MKKYVDLLGMLDIKQTALYCKFYKNLGPASKFCQNCSNFYNLMKQRGCYGNIGTTQAFPSNTTFSWPVTTTKLLENVRRCRDEVNKKEGLAGGYKAYFILTGILYQGQTVRHENS